MLRGVSFIVSGGLWLDFMRHVFLHEEFGMRYSMDYGVPAMERATRG